MPRANRYFLPGQIWHITHRCHKREFLLKFARDRRRWESWLFEARKRYGLSILNYVVTSNHIHLLVYGGEDMAVIPRSMQLVAGCTAQEYNRRKQRNGAYWEDRYHATAVESGEHLARCMRYIDMNMVRAGVVDRPEEWECCGYHEIGQPPRRYARIDRHQLAALLELPNPEGLAEWQQSIHTIAQAEDERRRCPEWTESIAVGREEYVAAIQDKLGLKARSRTVQRASPAGMHVLRESPSAYNSVFCPENAGLSSGNHIPWDVIS